LEAVLVDFDKSLLVNALKVAGERVGKGAAQSLLLAAHREMGRNGNSLEAAFDRITASFVEDVTGILKEEFGRFQADAGKVQQILEQR
jgi:hypothetical protein